jgi:ubiquinone/menaquinone biosynthesis C-methylase UbiE
VRPIDFQFSPRLYHWFVRPRWFTKKYIHDHITSHFTMERRFVLDFGCGTGANCSMVSPDYYVGVDADVRRTQFASKLNPGYKFHPLQSNELPLDNNTIDYVWIIAVLHHIPSDLITSYLKEFHRILKRNGRIIVIEPFLSDKTPLCNQFMKWFDRGRYIREENSYLKFFTDNQFSCDVHKKFQKCFLYNELFFSAKPQNLQPNQ